MKPLIVLLIAFVIAFFSIKVINSYYDWALAARVAMSVMLIFTSIAHFAFTKGMEMMMPGFIPFKKGIVYFTGVIEILAAIGLLIPAFRTLTAWWLILFFILILSANIHAAIKHVDHEKKSFDGKGIKYLWFRVPLQIFFIVWVYISAIKF